MMFRLPLISCLALSATLSPTWAEVSKTTVESLSAPASVETSLGTLKFKDGVPSAETAKQLFDTLDFTNALTVYNNSFRGASALGLVKGFQEMGAGSGDVIIFEELLDSNSLFLTGNADTVYYLSYVDLSEGPVVIEQPTDGLGTINDMWFSWVIDVGKPGPDRGLGGKYLIVGPDYDGPLPEGGFFVAHSKTSTILYAMRAFLADGDDPKPAVANIKQNLKIYPYAPGSYGTSIAEALKGVIKLAGEPTKPDMKFINGSGKSFNTIPPSDYGFFEMINENVQNEPATSYDIELSGQLAAIGIVHGKKFAPDDRMKKILADAAAVGQGVGRALQWRGLEENPDWVRYPGSQWYLPLWQGGAFFETPPPAFEDGMFKPLPPTGARTLDARTWFYYAYTLDSPGMIMQIPGVGSQYLLSFSDAKGDPFDGSKTYKVVLPKDIPAEAFWSFTLYDNQTRSMLATPQKYPRAGSQSYPSPATEAAEDGTTTVWFAPEQPEGVARGNWVQTDPKKGWFNILRLYSPKPAFFDKSWHPGEIELVQ
ncbi:DUF1254 domain-containing protein [Roseibium aggregatum]|uniref:DUF1254 domain-containing protein n=1 Tax=Roseibium aggregatum TaxID=187304 RepID=UPI003A7F49FA